MANHFKAALVQVSVPATSANLGPGFDSFGLALELRDRYAAQILDEAVIDVDVTGEGADEVKRDKNNLVIKAMMRGFEYMDAKPRGIALRQLNVIPHGRGLGSSASAIVGGLHLARALVLGGDQLSTFGSASSECRFVPVASTPYSPRCWIAPSKGEL